MSRMITWHGQTRSISGWARETKLPEQAIRWRINAGWPIDKALTERPQKRPEKKAAPCGAKTMYDCLRCELADCTAPSTIRLGGE